MTTPETPNKAEAVEAFDEAMRLKDLSRSFLYATNRYILERTPQLFGHVPEVMETYAAVSEKFEQAFRSAQYYYKMERNPRTGHDELKTHKLDYVTRDYFLDQKRSDIYGPVYEAVSNHLRKKLHQTQATTARLVVSDEEIAGVLNLATQFSERKDIDRPFSDHRWNFNQSFPISIHGQAYEATYVVSPDSEWKMDVILNHPERGKKTSVCITMGPKMGNDYCGLTREDRLYNDLYQMAAGYVQTFYELNHEIQQVQSGEKFGDMDVLGTAINLMTGAPADEEHYPEPVKAYALSLHMQKLRLANSGLNALEYAMMDGVPADRLMKVSKNPAEFSYHVLRGIIRLFKHVLLVANGEPGILDDDPFSKNSPQQSGGDTSICLPQDDFGGRMQEIV